MRASSSGLRSFNRPPTSTGCDPTRPRLCLHASGRPNNPSPPSIHPGRSRWIQVADYFRGCVADLDAHGVLADPKKLFPLPKVNKLLYYTLYECAPWRTTSERVAFGVLLLRAHGQTRDEWHRATGSRAGLAAGESTNAPAETRLLRGDGREITARHEGRAPGAGLRRQ